MIASLLLCFAADPEWTEFRAHGGLGAGRPPTVWAEGQNVKWKTPIPGKAWASPVVLGQQIWLANAPENGKQLRAVCVDLATGKIDRDVLVFDNPNPDFCHPTNSHASSTPALETGRLYVHFGSAGTACLDTATGNKLWERRDLECDHHRGAASSPILHGDRLFLTFDGVDVQYVCALDKHTGKTLWKFDRAIDYGTDSGDLKKGYGTPAVIDCGGAPALVSSGAMATIAYDPATGKERWRVKHGGMNAAVRPFAAAGLIYLGAGSGETKFLALPQDAAGDMTGKLAWKTGRNVPDRPTPVAVGELLFVVADNGVVSCLDAKTGTVHWSKRVAGQTWAAPIAADGKVYVFDQAGGGFVLAASKEFKLLATNHLAAGGNAIPAQVGNALIVRTFQALYRIEE